MSPSRPIIRVQNLITSLLPASQSSWNWVHIINALSKQPTHSPPEHGWRMLTANLPGLTIVTSQNVSPHRTASHWPQPPIASSGENFSNSFGPRCSSFRIHKSNLYSCARSRFGLVLLKYTSGGHLPAAAYLGAHLPASPCLISPRRSSVFLRH